MKSKNYCWVVCMVCVGVMFCTMGLTSTAFSVVLPYLIKEAGLTNTQGGIIPTIKPIASLIIVFFSNHIYRRIGKKNAVVLGCISLGIAFFLFGQSSYQLYLVAAVFAGFSYGLGGTLTISLLVRAWFESDRGMAIGFCSAGSGLASFIMPPVITALVEKYSLKTALIVPSVIAVIIAVLVLMIVRDTPEEMGMEPYRQGKKDGTAPKVVDEEGTKDKSIWYISIVAVFMMSIFGYGMIQNQALLYTTSGQPPMTVSMLISLCGITVMLIKPIYGKVTDQLGAYRSNYLFFGILIIGGLLSTMAGSKNLILAVAGVICLGISLPIASVGPSLYANDIGGKEAGKILRIYQIAIPIGQIFVGPVPGMIADRTGSYVLAYAFMTAVVVAAMFVIQIAYKKLAYERKTIRGVA